MSPVFAVLTRAGDLLRDVEQRLTDGGAVIELHQFQHLSAQEVDVLLWFERDEIHRGSPLVLHTTPREGLAS